MQDNLKTTKHWQQLNAFASAHPGYFDHAQACIKAWGNSGMQLQHVLAIAMKQMHELGLKGEHPVAAPVGAERDALAATMEDFAIDIKKPPKKKMTVAVDIPTVRRIGRTPPPPTIKRISRSAS